jgi:nucleoside-diphosphate-sugar epimerase
MKVVVFDASQGVGGLLVAGALRRAHRVTAFESGAAAGAGAAGAGPGVASGAAPGAAAGRLRALHGDLLDRIAVTDAVAEQDAVLYAVETSGGRDHATGAAEGMRNVLLAMRDEGVRRLVCLSAGGPGSDREGDRPGLFSRLFGGAPSADLLADLRQMEIAVRKSGGLSWTIVRAAKLTDDAGQQSIRSGPGYALPHGTKIARADVAEFMLDQLDDRTNVGHAVAIAW